MLVYSKKTHARNAILAGLPLPELASLSASLEPIDLRERMVLQEPKRGMEYVYFVESGLVSLRTVAAGSILETAIIGNRGAIGASILLGEYFPTRQSIVIVAGTALRIHFDDLRRVMNECPQVQEHVRRYVRALDLHNAQAGLCGVRHRHAQRLACWLCLASDALDKQVLPVTHDYLSHALALRRPSVTEALIRFEEQGLIRKMRGVLCIEDHGRLQQEACGCYGIIAGAYTSLEHLARDTLQYEVAVLSCNEQHGK
ncbi:Crp/Fnr family transcriptional regulator [Bradyrhizobium sp. SSUT18]|uniref:Crp/Fnr family transcriptional regulator n=1 Tax=Bradyrhizobium sp. SSUT18 TaxID=3040602 RepID=UPI002446EB17|nr:Crp/Fnr family transcriptional regulator [Bradyrhizobium sp. SSUT18]MDH2406638.1 Crp/Fnr family transcriptional regulator [Bradyrhizobium sp. SSUT18]